MRLEYLVRPRDASVLLDQALIHLFVLSFSLFAHAGCSHKGASHEHLPLGVDLFLERAPFVAFVPRSAPYDSFGLLKFPFVVQIMVKVVGSARGPVADPVSRSHFLIINS